MFFSFEDVDRKKISMVAVFVAAKSQREFRELERLIKATYVCNDRRSTPMDVKSEFYLNLKDELLSLENVLLSVLGFELDVELPHPYVVKICKLIKGSEELAAKSYHLATASAYAKARRDPVSDNDQCTESRKQSREASLGVETPLATGRASVSAYINTLVYDTFIDSAEELVVRITDGSKHVPRHIDNIPSLPGPSGSVSSGASTSNSNRPTVVPIEDTISIAIKKQKDPSPGPSNAEYINDAKEKKPVVVKKEPESSEQEEKTHLSVLPPKPSIPSEHQPTSHHALQIPNEHLLSACNESVELPEEKLQPPPPPLPQHQPQTPSPAVHVPNEHSSSKKSSKESLESSSSRKHESEHFSKSKISSSGNNSSNHSEPTSSGIVVKIRRDLISLSGLDCNQKCTPHVKAKSPEKPLNIKLPKPPPPLDSPEAENSSTPTSQKIVLTEDKSGSVSYSTSHSSEHRESRKRSLSGAVPDGSHRDHKNSVEPSIKYPKTEQYQKIHSGDQRTNKVSQLAPL
ncbi:hypothetical protein AVEN_109708-1 [Araneus ventricosus]|uniref:Cyclin N-terminal domain-containing protein n=1 Tax=Araneus ventricosus TaxID=182803 RepID=A0A4Y2PSQ5_ARAVE|nr:hypothetical protein AVEN_109708-1 [Araneus ventricosus]